jgi:hypothetical protein
MISREVQRDLVGLTLLPNLAACLFLWVVSALVTALPWPHSRREISLGRWLLSEAPPMVRMASIAGIGTYFVAAYFWSWTVAAGAWLPLAGVAVGLALVASLPYSGRRTDGGWSAASLGTVLVVTMLAFVPVALTSNLVEWWRPQVPALWLMGGERPAFTQQGTEFWVATGALLAAVTPATVLLLAAIRRKTVWQTANGLRLAFKMLAAVGAVLYLGYVLVATPASARDARTWDHVVAREAGGDPI